MSNIPQSPENRLGPDAWPAVLFALAWPTVFTAVYFLAAADMAPEAGQAAYAIGKLVQFVFPIAWMLLYERRRLGPQLPKLAPQRRALSLMFGAAFGLAVGGAMLAGYRWWLDPLGFFDRPSELVREKLIGFEVNTVSRYMALAVFYSLAHSALEEYYWRWFVFRRLSWLTEKWPAIAVSSIGFMAHHVIPLGVYFGWTSAATWFFTLSVGVGGAVWAWLYHRYQSLLGPWVSHLLVDAAIFAIGYDLVRDGL